MAIIQPIEHRGRIVALVAGGRALVDDELADGAVALVRAKCLYALEIQAGERPGPYTDQDAARYARHAVHPGAHARPPTPPGLRPPLAAAPSHVMVKATITSARCARRRVDGA